MTIVLFLIFIITMSIATHLIKKKIKHTLWFLKVRYVFRIFFKSIILVGLAYIFVSICFAYLTYPKYTATVDGYHEFNTTSDEGIKQVMYNVIYKVKVDEESLIIEDKKVSSSHKPITGKQTEVLYKDGDLMAYNPIMFLIMSLIGIGVFYYVIDLIKTDFLKKPLMPKKSFWGHSTTSHEVSISLNLDKNENEKEEN